MLALSLLVTTSLFQLQTPGPQPLAGRWVNQNPLNSSYIELKIEYRDDGPHLLLWTACGARDCYSGETTLRADGLPTAVFDDGLAKTALQLVALPDQRMLVIERTMYKDQSGPKVQAVVEFFSSEVPSNEPDSVAANSLLKKVSAAYRHISAAEFTSDYFSETLERGAVTRKTIRYKTTVAVPNLYRSERIGGEPEVTISNAQTTWRVFPGSNQYIKFPGSISNSRLPILDEYASLDELRWPAKITGSEPVEGLECVTLAIGRDVNNTRTLWIDPKTNFVRKEETRTVSQKEGSQSHSINTHTVRILDHPDPVLFSYDPAKSHAVDRQQLRKDTTSVSVGTPAPDFTLRNLNGEEVRLSQLRGKMVLLDFWATWCEPCRTAMPTTELIHRQFPEQELVVFGVDDETAEDQKLFLQKFGYSFPSLVDSTKNVASLYHVGGIPTAILIGTDGIIKFYESDASYEALWHVLKDQR